MSCRVSVIIPAYNRAHLIEKAVRSLQSQTVSDWEAVVVDDGSRDNTCAVVEKLAKSDPRVRLVRHDTNRRAQAARNSGIRAARGEWITFLDSDDEYLPDSLANRLSVAQKDRVPVVHSDCYILKPGQERQRYYIRPLQGAVYKQVLQKEGPVFPALLVRKDALERIGLLDESIKAYQEWDTSIRLAKYYRFGFYPEPTFVYDYRCDDSMSRDLIQNGRGYQQIFTKHFREILFMTGPGGVAHHYDVLARWARQGGDMKSARRFKIIAVIWKCVSPGRAVNRVKHIIKKILGRN